MKLGNYDESETLPYKVGCGGVVLREVAGKYEVLCLYRSAERFGMRGDSYHLPKGTLEPGETLEQCALRETIEESGAECEAIAYVGATTSDLMARNQQYEINYTRHFFLMKCIKQNESHDSEHDSVKWLPVEVAKSEFAKLPKGEESILQNALKFVEDNQIEL